MTDLEIVREILAGRKDLFADLVDRYKGLVFALIQSALRGDGTGEAEDLAQEVFLKAYRALPRFRGEASFSTWLYRIALNHLKDRLRARRPETVELTSIGERAADPDKSPEEAAARTEYRLLIQRSLAELPENYRQALYLYHYHDLSYAEIGGRLGVPARTIETRLYRAKKMLRESLAEREVTAGCATR